VRVLVSSGAVAVNFCGSFTGLMKSAGSTTRSSPTRRALPLMQPRRLTVDVHFPHCPDVQETTAVGLLVAVGGDPRLAPLRQPFPVRRHIRVTRAAPATRRSKPRSSRTPCCFGPGQPAAGRLCPHPRPATMHSTCLTGSAEELLKSLRVPVSTGDTPRTKPNLSRNRGCFFEVFRHEPPPRASDTRWCTS